MGFILRMAWRDTRASRRRLLLYSSTIVLGIAALVAVGAFSVNLRKTLGDEPRRLLGADLRVGLSTWPNAALIRYAASSGAELAPQKLLSSPLSGPSLVASREAVQVVAVDAGFPFYGEFLAEPAEAIARLRLGERVAIVDPRLAERYHLRVGQAIGLAAGTFTVAGIVKAMPGESSLMLSLSGRAFIPWSAAVPSAVPEHGNYRIYFRLPASAKAAAVAAEIKSRFGADLPIVMTADQLGQNIDRAVVAGSRFFSLVVFIALFLGAIGVASALQVYVQERLVSIGILRCLGASAGRALLIYLIQAAGLGLCGAIGGGLVGVGLQFALPWLTQDLLPIRLEVFLAWSPVLAGMGAGFAVCLVFALLPLLAVRRVSPLAALRSEAVQAAYRDPWRILVWLAIVAAVVGFARWQTQAWTPAAFYTLALVVACGMFAGLAQMVVAVGRRVIPARGPFVLRHGAGNLHRPHNRTTLLLVSLGMGLFLVLTVYLCRATLRRDFAGENNPNLVLSEIGDGDLAGVNAAVRAHALQTLRQIPVLALTVEAINGKKFVREAEPGRRGPARRGLGGEFDGKVQATRRGALLPSEQLVAGVFPAAAAAGDAIIPITVAQWLTVARPPGHPVFKLGDEVVWNVEGVPVRTQIVGVRQVRGMAVEPNYAVVFPAGAVEGAPAKQLLLLRSPSAAATARLSEDLARSFPTVKAWDIAALLETMERIFAKLAAVVDFVAFFTIATGLIILASAVVAGRHQRARESVLLRTMGATRGQLRAIQLVEYGAVGLLAGTLGCGLAEIASVLLARFVLHLPPGGGEGGMLLAGALLAGATVVTGVLADRGLSRLSPLEILRQET